MTSDLWDALESASGQPVRALMDSWILQGGFPLVSAGTHTGPSGAGSLTLTQEPFSLAAAAGPSSIGTRWQIPVHVRTLDGVGPASEARIMLGSPTGVVTIDGVAGGGGGAGPGGASPGAGPGDGAHEVMVVNAGGVGYFRVRYPGPHLKRLAARLGELDALERFTVLSDTWAAVVAGRTEIESFLHLAEALGHLADLAVAVALPVAGRTPPERASDVLAFRLWYLNVEQAVSSYARWSSRVNGAVVEIYDTAGAVKMVMAAGQADVAAIGSRVAASIYGGKILRRSIEDDRHNFTRFFLLYPAKRFPRQAQAASPSKTSLVFTTRNIPGALFRALSAFALRDLSLTKIESRPLHGKPWEYLFYLDFLGHQDEPRVQNALGHLKELADFLRVLGSYPLGS